MSGVSGIGVVAEGVQCYDGSVVMYWLTKTPSIGLYKSVEDLEAIHGHGGATKVEWL